MLPIVFHTSSFYNFTSSIIRRPIPFSGLRRFWDFSSLVEAFVLSDEIFYWNTGAAHMEWIHGYYGIPNNKPPFHPYEIFHHSDFIKDPFEDIDRLRSLQSSKHKLIEYVEKTTRDKIILEKLGKEPNDPFTIWSSLSLYEQAMNGELGDVCIHEPAVIQDVLPDLVVYCGETQPVSKDPYIFQSYSKLKEKYNEIVSSFPHEHVLKYVVPPVTAIFLSRLPDNCTNPDVAIRQLYELREELEPVRRKFSELEDVFFDNEGTLEGLSRLNSALTLDAKSFENNFGLEFSETAAVQWFADKLIYIIKLLIKGCIDLTDIVDLIGGDLENINKRIAGRTPTRLYHLAMDTKKIRGRYSDLANKKLGFDI